MRLVPGYTAIVTGASRGLGVYMARALAQRGLNLVLAARSAEALEEVRAEMERLGVQALAVPTDVSDPAARAHLIHVATDVFGHIDVLVNNAGIEVVLPYEDVTEEEIQRVNEVNLTAPMHLTRLVWPGMIARGRGHVVNIASLAGLMPSPYSETYTASKHGLVGFTRSLRLSAQMQDLPVSASVVCPGFTDDAGMYANQVATYDTQAHWLLGSVPADVVAEGVITAIETDDPEHIVAARPLRPLMALNALLPRLTERIARSLPFFQNFQRVAAARSRGRRRRAQRKAGSSS